MAEGKSKEVKKEGLIQEESVCFVIMPFSDPDGYEPGHFKKV